MVESGWLQAGFGKPGVFDSLCTCLRLVLWVCIPLKHKLKP